VERTTRVDRNRSLPVFRAEPLCFQRARGFNARELTAGSPLVHRDNPSVGKALAQEEMALKWAGEPI